MPAGRALDAAAHPLQDVDEADVALQAVRRSAPGRVTVAAGDGGGGEEVARGRGVGFDGVSLPSAVAACRPGTRKTLSRPSASTPQAELSHHRTRHVDVGPRHERPVDVERRRRAAANGAAISRPLRNWLLTSPRTANVAAAQAVGLDDHRRTAVARLAVGVGRRAGRRASSRSSIGRSRIRGTPSSR